jgi:hypothetical protein
MNLGDCEGHRIQVAFSTAGGKELSQRQGVSMAVGCIRQWLAQTDPAAESPLL